MVLIHVFNMFEQKENDGKYRRPLKAITGNGLHGLALGIWEEFQTRFNIGQIFEVYGATDGNFFLVNLDGHTGSVGKYPWLLKVAEDIYTERQKKLITSSE